MITAIITIASITVFIIILIFLGLSLKSRLVNKLIEERNNLDLRTQEGKTRAKVLNKRIDRLYGFK